METTRWVLWAQNLLPWRVREVNLHFAVPGTGKWKKKWNDHQFTPMRHFLFNLSIRPLSQRSTRVASVSARPNHILQSSSSDVRNSRLLSETINPDYQFQILIFLSVFISNGHLEYVYAPGRCLSVLLCTQNGPIHDLLLLVSYTAGRDWICPAPNLHSLPIFTSWEDCLWASVHPLGLQPLRCWWNVESFWGSTSREVALRCGLLDEWSRDCIHSGIPPWASCSSSNSGYPHVGIAGIIPTAWLKRSNGLKHTISLIGIEQGLSLLLIHLSSDLVEISTVIILVVLSYHYIGQTFFHGVERWWWVSLTPSPFTRMLSCRVRLISLSWWNLRSGWVEFCFWKLYELNSLSPPVSPYLACLPWGLLTQDRSLSILMNFVRDGCFNLLIHVLSALTLLWRKPNVPLVLCSVCYSRRRRFPPKPKLLTEQEYITQGAEETAKSLEELRKFCNSPDCNSWKMVSRLRDPKR